MQSSTGSPHLFCPASMGPDDLQLAPPTFLACDALDGGDSTGLLGRCQNFPHVCPCLPVQVHMLVVHRGCSCCLHLQSSLLLHIICKTCTWIMLSEPVLCFILSACDPHRRTAACG